MDLLVSFHRAVLAVGRELAFVVVFGLAPGLLGLLLGVTLYLLGRAE